ATEWFSYAEEHILRGSTGAVLKDDHKAVKKAHRTASSISEQATCMSIVLSLLCKDGIVWSEIERNRLSLIIEKSGSEDGGVRYGIERLAVANDFLASALETVTFADKERVRAL